MSDTAISTPPARPAAASVGERFWGWVRNPWGQPRFLVAVAWLFMAWSILPILLAMLFSFNAGRSRSVWQGFSIHWWWGSATNAIFQTPQYFDAIQQSLKLAAVDVAIATPLGVALALGLVRWRGWGQKPANMLMLFPLVTPELVMAVSLFLIFTQISVFPFGRNELGTTAQAIGQVTFSVSYVVVIVRARLLSIGREYEEAARDLGASSGQALRLALLPLLYPAVFAGAMIVFATSIDDFVVTQYMSSGASTETIPMLIYGNARGGSVTPALNAVATVLVVLTIISLALAFLVYRLLSRGEKSQSTQTAIGDFGAFELS